MNKNPYAPKVPCHRVVGSNGALTGFTSGLPKKAALLKQEGIAIKEGKVDLAAHEYQSTSFIKHHSL